MWKPPCRTPGPDFPPPPWSTPSATYSGYGPGETSLQPALPSPLSLRLTERSVQPSARHLENATIARGRGRRGRRRRMSPPRASPRATARLAPVQARRPSTRGAAQPDGPPCGARVRAPRSANASSAEIPSTRRTVAGAGCAAASRPPAGGALAWDTRASLLLVGCCQPAPPRPLEPCAGPPRERRSSPGKPGPSNGGAVRPAAEDSGLETLGTSPTRRVLPARRKTAPFYVFQHEFSLLT